MKIVYFKNHRLTLSFDPEQKMGLAVWVGFLNSQEFREATTKCIELISQEGLTKWLSDNREMKVIKQADQQWYVENVAPSLRQSTLKRIATLVSHDIFNQMAVEHMKEAAGNMYHLKMHDFTDKSEAITWLLAPVAKLSSYKLV